MHELRGMSKEDAAGGKTPGRWLTTTPQCQDDADAGEPYRDCAKASLALCLIDIGPGFSKHASAPRGSQNLNVLFFFKARTLHDPIHATRRLDTKGRRHHNLSLKGFSACVTDPSASYLGKTMT